ncbi:uncharacterized protein [Physcomitrium patens]|uniref:uncharacterized protein isoform X1 n=1 Tax=Physcomitrium patens TaxID=3218 RepID=UPI000D157CCE|nr:methyltransferase-like protein 22 isoform X1 [Physcomitrium patens]|eukprot:XP_024370763.1 methyltransferase-like protein 22 isoform X1 [Physcomitrella patens]
MLSRLTAAGGSSPVLRGLGGELQRRTGIVEAMATEAAIDADPSIDSGSDSEEPYFDASFFVDETYVEKEFVVGAHTIKVLCLQCSSTDYDLTGQLVWPGAGILNDYLVSHSNVLDGVSVIELGSGVGVGRLLMTVHECGDLLVDVGVEDHSVKGLNGLLCARYSRHVVMTDHNTTVLKVMKKNVELQGDTLQSKVDCEELDWGNEVHVGHIKETYPDGFDLILGADICYHQSAVKPLFATVKALMELRPVGSCKFILGYVSRFKSNDIAVNAEVQRLKMDICEAPGTRKSLAGGAHEGWVYEISIKPDQS